MLTEFSSKISENQVGERRQGRSRRRPQRNLRKRRKSEKPEPAISRVLSRAIIHLGRPSPAASSNLPGSPLGTGGAAVKPRTPLFGLAPGGVYRAADCYQPRGALLPHLFTLTGLQSPAVCFLWHFPWARALQALPGALSEGARTFLCLCSRQRLPGRLRLFRTTNSKAFAAAALRCRRKLDN